MAVVVFSLNLDPEMSAVPGIDLLDYVQREASVGSETPGRKIEIIIDA